MKLVASLTTLAILMVLLPSPALSLSDFGDGQVLKGARSVITFTSVAADLENWASKKHLTSSTELLLRTSGIRVIDTTDAVDPNALGLSVEIGGLVSRTQSGDETGVVFTISVAVMSLVEIDGTPGEVPAVIWERSTVATASKEGAQEFIKSIVSEFVAEFANDYLKANQ